MSEVNTLEPQSIKAPEESLLDLEFDGPFAITYREFIQSALSVSNLSNVDKIDILNASEERAHLILDTVLKKLNLSGSRILYLASSYGMGPFVLNHLGYEVRGVELNQRAAQFANKQGIYTYHLSAERIDQIEEIDNWLPDVIVTRDFLREDYLPREMITKILISIKQLLPNSGIFINNTILFKEDALSHFAYVWGNNPFENKRRIAISGTGKEEDYNITYADVFSNQEIQL